MNLHILLNEHAGNGRAKRTYDELKHRLTIPYTLHKTEKPTHATAIVQKIAQLEGNHCCIILGGDGTIHEAIQGAIGSDVVIGAMNAGSGNDFGRGFTAFKNSAEIEQYMKNPLTSLQDAGQVRNGDFHTYFMNNAGYGIDAAVTYRVNRSSLKKWFNKIGLGKLSYVLILIDEVLKFKPFSIEVRKDGQVTRYDNVWVTAFSNQPFIGGGMNLSPYSDTTDGQLELTIVHDVSKFFILGVFGTIFFGKHILFKKFVKQFRVKEATFTYDAPMIGHADGEYIGLSKGETTVRAHHHAWYHVAKKLD